jgi:hypothetical protein
MSYSDMRVWKSLVVIGLAVAGASFMSDSSSSFGTAIDYGEYRGMAFETSGDMYMIVFAGGSSFSLYVLDHNDTLKALESASLENTTPLVELENITVYDGLIRFPSPGSYSLLVTPVYNETISVEIGISSAQSTAKLLIPGVAISSIGILMIILPRALAKVRDGDRNDNEGAERDGRA